MRGPRRSDATRRRPRPPRRRVADCAVHLVAGSTTSPVLAQIARSELARPLVNASVERFSRAKHVFTCILLQSSILHRLFGCIRSVSGRASYGVQGHSGNARMQTYADAQQARASSSVLSTRCFCDVCTRAVHAELRWRIELPALHAVYENDTGAIRQRVEVSVAKEEIGLSPNFIGPHSERERVALDLFDSIVEELSWCARAGRVSTDRSHRLHRRRDPQLP